MIPNDRLAHFEVAARPYSINGLKNVAVVYFILKVIVSMH